MKVVKVLAVLAIVFVAWKYGVPWVKNLGKGPATNDAATLNVGGGACVAAAEKANDSFGNGIGKFVNPPYDISAWETFRAEVGRNADAADVACSSPTDSCRKARDAMRDLRSLMSDLDTAIRNNAPPSSDIVQRQGAVSEQVDKAKELAGAGR